MLVVHNQRQIHTLQAGMKCPGLSQTMSTEVAPQTNLLADGIDELPGLTTPNGFSSANARDPKHANQW